MPDYRRRSAREAMRVRLDLSGVLAEQREEQRLERRELEGVVSQLAGLTEHFQRSRDSGELACLRVPEQRQMLSEIKTLAEGVRSQGDTLVVVGAGGTARAVQAVVGSLGDGVPRILFFHHTDPYLLGQALEGLDLRRTIFHFVSKSGETPETMAQFLLLRDLLLRELGGVDYVERLLVTTDADQGTLRQIVHDEGFRSLAMPPGVAERFSVFTAAALFPAAVAGVRIDEFLAGAAWMEQRCAVRDAWQNPAALLAAVAFVLERQHRVQGLLCMPFSERLERVAEWASGLWMEALRRNETAGGAPVVVPWVSLAHGDGDCALAAQIAAGGAGGTLTVLLTVEDHGRELPLPAAYGDLESIGYLGGKGLGEVSRRRAEALATVLCRRRSPVVRLQLPQVNPFALGQLLYLWQCATVYLAYLYGVDPLRQPVADEYRRLLLALLGRKGTQQEAEEIEQLWRERPQWLL